MEKFLLYKIVIFGIIGMSILFNTVKAVRKSNIDYVIVPIIDTIASILTFMLILLKYENINNVLSYFIKNILGHSYLANGIIKILGIIVLFIIIKFIIKSIISIVQSTIFSGGKKVINESKTLLIIFSTIFGIARVCIFILILFVPIIMFNSIPNNPYKINVFNDVSAFNKMEEIIDNNKSKFINNGLIKDIQANRIIYYNGVTLDEGVKSNDAINEKARKIVSSSKNDREKAKKIYSWIGSNITYDYDKANKILNSQNVKNSGAIPAYEEGKGICFDYACLYVAMARATSIKVRLVNGEAFNGEKYVSHAWNEVYLSDEKKWIKVDPTFYNAGNYFDSDKFDDIHKKENIAGEW